MATQKVVRVHAPTVRTIVIITKEQYVLLKEWVPPALLRKLGQKL